MNHQPRNDIGQVCATCRLPLHPEIPLKQDAVVLLIVHESLLWPDIICMASSRLKSCDEKKTV